MEREEGMNLIQASVSESIQYLGSDAAEGSCNPAG